MDHDDMIDMIQGSLLLCSIALPSLADCVPVLTASEESHESVGCDLEKIHNKAVWSLG
jgi:hypothetical protein